MIKPLSVLLVDDFPVVTEGLASILAGEKGLKVCATAATVKSAFAMAKRHRPDLAVLDLQMGAGDGVEFVGEMRRRFPGMRILVLSMHEESLYALRVMSAGADGYIMKARAARDLIAALRVIVAGKKYLSPKMMQRMAGPASAQHRRAGQSVGVEVLSDRELQVFSRLGRAHSTRQIAGELGLSIKTIDTYRENIKIKLDLRTAAELVHLATAWTRGVKLLQEPQPGL